MKTTATQQPETFKFHLTYIVEGREKEIVSIQENEEMAKQDVRDMYGKTVEVEFLEVINTSVL